MNKPLCLAALVAALAACRPAAPEAAAPTVPAADQATTPTPASASAPMPAPASVPAPAATLAAGTFAGTLPCADCPGIDTTLVLAADGRYTLTSSYRECNVEPLRSEGAWTLSADGQRLRLAPADGTGALQYEVVSADQLRQLDLQGHPIDSALDFSLRRAGS